MVRSDYMRRIEGELGAAKSALAEMREQLSIVTRERDELRREAAEHDASFQLRWKTDMRAIERWQKATGRTMTWPDHADLCCWLMDQLDAAAPVATGLGEQT